MHKRSGNNLCKGKSPVSVGLVLMHSLAALKFIRSVRSNTDLVCIGGRGAVCVIKRSIFASASVNHIF